MRRHITFTAVAAMAAVVGGLAPAASAGTTGFSTSGSAVAAAGDGVLAAFGRQTVAWQACGPFQCAVLTVPLDYRDPAGPVVHLPVIKASAADPAHRVGTLFVDPGGPAASGVGFVETSLATLSPNLRARFDVVAWDRRGTGASDPALRCQSDAALDAYNHLDPASPDVDALLRAGSDYAAACRMASAAGLTSDMGTLASTFDTEVLRAALGEARISYLGFSYGTFQGAWYAQLFPARVRSMVLDGMFDPELTGEQLLVGQAKSFGAEVAYYEEACASVDGEQCPAPTAAGMRALIDGLTATVRTRPLPVTGSARTVGPAELAAALEVIAIAPEVTWSMADAALAQAAAGDGAGVEAMADLWNGRSADGAGPGPGGAYDGTAVAGQALWCDDRAWPATAQDWAALRSAAVAAGPQVGAMRAEQALPCAGWDAPTLAPVPLTAAGAPPIVVVSTTGDPATPYQWGVDAAAHFAHGVLVTFRGHGHTAYGRSNDCVTAAVDGDLISGVPPRDGTVC